jgi:hypothetical protein
MLASDDVVRKDDGRLLFQPALISELDRSINELETWKRIFEHSICHWSQLEANASPREREFKRRPWLTYG